MSAENLFTTSRIENVNQIIAELYDDSILLEKRMESFFLNLNNIVFFEKANFLFYQKQGQNYKTHSIYTINWNDEQKRRYQEEYCHMDDVLSILDSDSNVTFLTNQLFNQEVRKNSLYFQEFLLPMGLHDSIETNFSIRNRDLRGVFSIHRSNDKKNFLPDELSLVRLFQPHFCNVFKNYGRELNIGRAFHVLENYNCIGIGCFDDKLNFIGCNTTYHTYMENHGFADLSNNPISNCFRSLCRQLLRSGSITGQNIEYKMENSPLFLEVSRSHLKEGPDNDCFVCLFFDLSYVMDRTLSQISRDFSLTNREVNVLSLLLRGYSNDQISSTLFVSIPTVKKHLASIYSKMEIKRPEANSGTPSFLRQIFFALILFNHEKRESAHPADSLFRAPFLLWLSSLLFLGFSFFVLDLPMNQKCKHCPKDNDGSQNSKFRPLSYHNRPEYLAAHLKFQRQRNSLCQIQADQLTLVSYPLNKAGSRCLNQHNDSKQF